MNIKGVRPKFCRSKLILNYLEVCLFEVTFPLLEMRQINNKIIYD